MKTVWIVRNGILVPMDLPHYREYQKKLREAESSGKPIETTPVQIIGRDGQPVPPEEYKGITYSEPPEYFPEDIRKQYKLGEYAEDREK